MPLEKFKGFDNRETELSKIIRFNMERRTPMFYRTNVLLHSQRVYFLLKDFAKVIEDTYKQKFDIRKALTLALVHDDAEIITGDVQAYHKDRMTQDQLAELDETEAKAIEVISSRWPEKVNDFSYRELLYHALYKDCLEAQVVSYCDKADAFCESLHEVFAGNPKFEGTALSYISKLRDFPVKFPSLEALLPGEHPLLKFPEDLNTSRILSNGRFHTREAVKEPTGIPHYDRWRELTVQNFGLRPLVVIKEY